MSSTCVICAEDIDSKRKKARLGCSCNDQVILCEECLHSHILSILREGITGEGRKDLKCPLGCGEELTDGTIRVSIRSFHYSLFHAVIGQLLWYLWLILKFILGDYYHYQNNPYASTDRRRIQCLLTQSQEERKELELYERWSLTVGLSRLMESHNDQVCSKVAMERDSNFHYVHVIRCPRPDCECLWLTNKTFRNQKLKNEHKHTTTGISNSITKSFIQSASSWLFYTPTSISQEETIMNQSGNYTIEHWLNANDMDTFNKLDQKAPIIMNETNKDDDGRRVSCPSCNLEFCGLCTRPWTTIYKNKRMKHSGMTCDSYAKKSPEKDNDDYIMAADMIGAKCCPGCSMRTARTEGCNHMTCPCGYHWCYICECRWNARHYACRERSPGNQTANSYCIIS